MRILHWLVACLCLAVCLAGVAGCSDYPQDSPDAVLASARKMVVKGDARRLTRLIYADSKQMRALLEDMGGMLQTLQGLAVAVQKAYPQEITKLKEEAEQAAKDGKASSFIQGLVSQMSGGARGRRAAVGVGQGGPNIDAGEARSAFDNAMKELFADPYGWLEQSEGRLTVQKMTDDMAAIKWDDKPIFGGLGPTLQLHDGKWYLALPTNAPGVGNILPKTDDGWEILGDVVQVFDQTLSDLTDDVKQKRCKRLDELAAKAGEKAFLPAVMVFFAYGKYMEAERPPGEKLGQLGRRRGRGGDGTGGASGTTGPPPATGAAPPTSTPAPGGG